MLFCETTRAGAGAAEDLAILASQLAALGVPARVATNSVPASPGHNLQFDLAPRLADGRLGEGDGLALIAAEQLTDETLMRLRRLAGGVEVAARAFGRFTPHETAIGVRARLSYILGREPELFDLGQANPGWLGPAPAFGVRRPAGPGAHGQGAAPPRLLLVGPDLKDRTQAAALLALAARRGLNTTVLTDSGSKQRWIAAHGQQVAVFSHGEILPLALARRTDVCILYASVGSSYRLQTLIANLLLDGVPLLDGTAGRQLCRQGDAFIPAPAGVLGLEGFLGEDILPNLGAIARHVRESRSAAQVAPEPVLRFLATEKPAGRRRPAPAPAEGGVLFMPTNGVGLGHAQRCALIARALGRRQSRPVFAAFPSCTGLIKSHGFDVVPLIGRSPFHARGYDNDLANYLRLRAVTGGSGTLVFDGGFAFDSVFRTILETELRGIWIRRGLWQGGQASPVALDREKVFERVIVPREAFDELNAEEPRGGRVHAVGPIVQQVPLPDRSRDELRGRLAERYGRGFERLVVSLLGAGIAADRSTQIQALCGQFERRADTLHLVVVWPSATLEPGWFAWRNSRVVRTQRAALLGAAADLVITASGYNSFHEALYNRSATIFMPQMAPSTDDQRARAQAACDRGLAVMVEPTELMRLERLVALHLDDGEAEAARARLAAAELPEPGTAQAAQLIEEVAFGEAEAGQPGMGRPA